jgi:hypothetical protein
LWREGFEHCSFISLSQPPGHFYGIDKYCGRFIVMTVGLCPSSCIKTPKGFTGVRLILHLIPSDRFCTKMCCFAAHPGCVCMYTGLTSLWHVFPKTITMAFSYMTFLSFCIRCDLLKWMCLFFLRLLNIDELLIGSWILFSGWLQVLIGWSEFHIAALKRKINKTLYCSLCKKNNRDWRVGKEDCGG